MNTNMMSDTDKVLAAHARAANAKTSRLHAEICGGADKAKAIQNVAVTQAAVRNAPVVNEDPFLEPVSPYNKPGDNATPTRAGGPAATAPRRGAEEAFAEPVSPYAKPDDATKPGK